MLGGRRFSSIIHSTTPIKDLLGLLSHIAEQYPETVKFYRMLDKPVKALLNGSPPSDVNNTWIYDKIEDYLRELNVLVTKGRSEASTQDGKRGLSSRKRKRV
ncbi:hypothetical protein EYZ11_012785 [Aspergillus tanneri]|uniref:Uncharacterized protein n=1 Tax=Aspergillus tanneri TaxID=1220188 RepID=A0A4S3IZW0_9EURO|nr:hypothetical protein EYZ11_012785 [Aspergillus tanneri]